MSDLRIPVVTTSGIDGRMCVPISIVSSNVAWAAGSYDPQQLEILPGIERLGIGAKAIGADAVVGLQIHFATQADGGLFVQLLGTAVKFETFTTGGAPGIPFAQA